MQGTIKILEFLVKIAVDRDQITLFPLFNGLNRIAKCFVFNIVSIATPSPEREEA